MLRAKNGTPDLPAGTRNPIRFGSGLKTIEDVLNMLEQKLESRSSWRMNCYCYAN